MMKKKKDLKRNSITYFLGRGSSTLFVLVSAFVFVFPLIWMVSNSLKEQSAAISLPPEIIVINPTISNFFYILKETKILIWIKNSVVVSGGTTILILFIAAMAAYALTRIRFIGKGKIFTMIVVSMMIPIQLTLVPLFSMMRSADLVNTPWAVILPALSCPAAVFMLKQFSQTIPSELFQAARIDGCGEMGLFFKIYIPLVKPGIGALAISTFTLAWNNYLWQLVMLTNSDAMTLPVGIKMLSAEYVAEYGNMMAAATFGLLPTMILFFACQKYFVKGITLGGVKG